MKETNFIPVVGMIPINMEGHGYKGEIEYVGKDYFILRSYRTNEPILIKEFQYYNFEGYKLPDYSQLHPIFQDIFSSIFPPIK